MAGRRVLVVEDVVTSGGQIVISTSELRKLGAQIAHALCVSTANKAAPKPSPRTTSNSPPY